VVDDCGLMDGIYGIDGIWYLVDGLEQEFYDIPHIGNFNIPIDWQPVQKIQKLSGISDYKVRPLRYTLAYEPHWLDPYIPN